MKIFRILLTAAIVLGMTACNNEDPVDLTGQPESTVSVRIVPTSDAPAVRSAGNLSGTGVTATGLVAESEIKLLEVYIFHGELPDGYKSATGTNVTQVLDIATHAGPRTIVVVANAGTAIGAVPNKTALLAKTKDIPVTIANGIPMTSTPVDVTLVGGKNQYGFSTTTANYASGANQISVDTPLPLVRVNARVAIVSATLTGTLPPDQLLIFDALTDIQVAMFNVPKTSKLFGAPLAMNSDFLFGEAWPSPLGTYTVGTANAAFKETGASTLPITVANAPYFYVTENTSTVAKEQMFIVLRAKPTKGGNPVVSEGLYTDAAGYTYYPIWVNNGTLGYTYNAGHTGNSQIVRNTQYNISLSINKIGNPTIDPPVAAQLDVNVSVEPWTVVTQSVTW